MVKEDDYIEYEDDYDRVRQRKVELLHKTYDFTLDYLKSKSLSDLVELEDREKDLAKKPIEVDVDEDDEEEDEEAEETPKKKIKAKDMIEEDNPFYDPHAESITKQQDMLNAELPNPADFSNPFRYEEAVLEVLPKTKQDFKAISSNRTTDFINEVVQTAMSIKRVQDVADGENRIMRGGEKRYPKGVVDGDDPYVEEKIRGSPYQSNQYTAWDSKIPAHFDKDTVIVDVQKPQRSDFTPIIKKALDHTIAKYNKEKEMSDLNKKRSFESRNDFFRSVGYKDDLTEKDFYNGFADEYDFLPKTLKDKDNIVKYILKTFDFSGE